MTEGQESKGVPPMFTDERVLAWMEEHLTELRQSVSGQRILYQSLVISFVVGLAAHVGGYALLSSAPSGLLGLLADLLRALGIRESCFQRAAGFHPGGAEYLLE